MAAPKVALVHDHLVQDGGAEQVLRVLMRMWPEAPVYTFLYEPGKMGEDFRGKDIRTSGWQRSRFLRTHYKPLLPFIDGAFRRFDLSGYDLVISSASGWAKGVRTGPNTLHVCYCHTPTRYLWSSADDYIAETGYPAPLKWAFRRTLGWLRKKDLRAAAGVDRYVANSKYVAARIKRYYGRESEVINPPVQVEEFGAGPKQDYFLVATRLEPYKRVDLAIQAANELAVPLKVMGNGTDRQRLERLAGPTVEFVGRVSDTERKRLFGSATAFLNPQEEDFGITTVEALASGTPVIAYGKGGAAEIIEDGVHGLLFATQDLEDLVGAIRAFDPAKFKPATLQRRAKLFSEDAFRVQLDAFVGEAYQQFKADANRR